MIGSNIITVARGYLNVREIGSNRGPWVEKFLAFTGNEPGDSWCAAFASYVLNAAYSGHSPLIKSAGCDELLNDARKKGFITTSPVAGDLVFSVHNGDAHHVAILTRDVHPMDQMMVAIAGNTSHDGVSSNGDGVYEHPVSRFEKVYVHLPEPKA